jgi:hypothetical protein
VRAPGMPNAPPLKAGIPRVLGHLAAPKKRTARPERGRAMAAAAGGQSGQSGHREQDA